MDRSFPRLGPQWGGRASKTLIKTMVYLLCFTLVSSGAILPGVSRAQVIPFDPQSLKETPVPEPMAAVVLRVPGPNVNLNFQPLTARIVKDQAALVRLGKALFWDMQVGSDGVQACATCHFNAGADVRAKNQIAPNILDTNFKNPVLNPLGGDNSFGNATVLYTANDPNNPFGPVEPPDPNFNVPGFPQFTPNYELVRADFPLNGWMRPTLLVPRGPGVTIFEELFDVDADTNDVISSMGVRRTQFVGITPGSDVDDGAPLPDIWNVVTPGKLNLQGKVRRVEPRNAPTMINAVFNFDNFWDGRASFVFNGVNPFGFRDRSSKLKRTVLVNGVPTLQDVFVRVTNSSLASQAVGPPMSDFEMSWAGRSFPELAKKLFSLQPLGKQIVDPQDSVLGPLARAGLPGLKTNYPAMIRAAFKSQWYSNTAVITVNPATAAVQKASANDPRTMVVSPGQGVVTSAKKTGGPLAANQYTQMEYNFSLFWGLAVQAYEATLISDDTPFDRFMGAPTKNIPADHTALTDQERLGFDIFVSSGKCNNCHVAPITSNHTVLYVSPDGQGVPKGLDGIIQFMAMGDGGTANYDNGMYNIAVRRTTEDLGRAGTAPNAGPFLNPLDNNNPFPLSYVELAALKGQKKLPPDVSRFVPTVPVLDRRVSRGAFKVPNLRNIEFSGPYFHNGDSATLRQVVEFYTRGGNFPNTNLHELTEDIEGIPELMFPDTSPNAKQNIEALVAFLANGLTDQRVAMEKAPFDHPQLFIPTGAQDGAPELDTMLELPAVGANGRVAPIPTFLNLDPQDPGL
ncbi:MAG: cytochrome c peroxidase [Syntrophobacteraceae bacterium]